MAHKDHTTVSRRERRACSARGYKISNTFLGGGAVGRVFLAEATDYVVSENSKLQLIAQHVQPLKVAIKIIYTDVGALNLQKLAKYIPNEISNMNKAFGHCNIIMLLDVFVSTKRVFLVTELAGKGSIKSLCRAKLRVNRNNRSMSEAEARYYFREIVCGLTSLHSKKIAHRDLKLDNILICESGQIKIADFGFSVKLPVYDPLEENMLEVARDLVNSTMCGTPAFMAPEILHGFGGYDAIRTDLWSLGVILFILTNGQYPFMGKTTKDVLHQIEKRGCDDLPFREDLSQDCQDLIKKLLRYQSWERISTFAILHHPWMNVKNPAETPDYVTTQPIRLEEKEIASMKHDPVYDLQEKYVRSYLLQRCELLSSKLIEFKQQKKIPSTIARDFGIPVAVPRLEGTEESLKFEFWRLNSVGHGSTQNDDEEIDAILFLDPAYGLPLACEWNEYQQGSTVGVPHTRRIMLKTSILDNWRRLRDKNEPPLTEIEKCVQLYNTVDLDVDKVWPFEYRVPKPTAEWVKVRKPSGPNPFYHHVYPVRELNGVKMTLQEITRPILDSGLILVPCNSRTEVNRNLNDYHLQQVSNVEAATLSGPEDKPVSDTLSQFTFNQSAEITLEPKLKKSKFQKSRLPVHSSRKILEKMKRRKEAEKIRRDTLPACAFYTPRGVTPTPKVKIDLEPVDISKVLYRDEKGETKIPSPRRTWLHEKYSFEKSINDSTMDRSSTTTSDPRFTSRCSGLFSSMSKASHIPLHSSRKALEERLKKKQKEEERKRSLPACAFYTPRGVTISSKPKYTPKEIDFEKIKQRPDYGPTKIPFPDTISPRMPLNIDKTPSDENQGHSTIEHLLPEDNEIVVAETSSEKQNYDKTRRSPINCSFQNTKSDIFLTSQPSCEISYGNIVQPNANCGDLESQSSTTTTKRKPATVIQHFRKKITKMISPKRKLKENSALQTASKKSRDDPVDTTLQQLQEADETVETLSWNALVSAEQNDPSIVSNCRVSCENVSTSSCVNEEAHPPGSRNVSLTGIGGQRKRQDEECNASVNSRCGSEYFTESLSISINETLHMNFLEKDRTDFDKLGNPRLPRQFDYTTREFSTDHSSQAAEKNQAAALLTSEKGVYETISDYCKINKSIEKSFLTERALESSNQLQSIEKKATIRNAASEDLNDEKPLSIPRQLIEAQNAESFSDLPKLLAHKGNAIIEAEDFEKSIFAENSSGSVDETVDTAFLPVENRQSTKSVDKTPTAPMIKVMTSLNESGSSKDPEMQSSLPEHAEDHKVVTKEKNGSSVTNPDYEMQPLEGSGSQNNVEIPSLSQIQEVESGSDALKISIPKCNETRGKIAESTITNFDVTDDRPEVSIAETVAHTAQKNAKTAEEVDTVSKVLDPLECLSKPRKPLLRSETSNDLLPTDESISWMTFINRQIDDQEDSHASFFGEKPRGFTTNMLIDEPINLLCSDEASLHWSDETSLSTKNDENSQTNFIQNNPDLPPPAQLLDVTCLEICKPEEIESTFNTEVYCIPEHEVPNVGNHEAVVDAGKDKNISKKVIDRSRNVSMKANAEKSNEAWLEPEQKVAFIGQEQSRDSTNVTKREFSKPAAEIEISQQKSAENNSVIKSQDDQIDLERRHALSLNFSGMSSFAGSINEEKRTKIHDKYGYSDDSIAFICNNKIPDNVWLAELSSSNCSNVLSERNSEPAQNISTIASFETSTGNSHSTNRSTREYRDVAISHERQNIPYIEDYRQLPAECKDIAKNSFENQVATQLPDDGGSQYMLNQCEDEQSLVMLERKQSSCSDKKFRTTSELVKAMAHAGSSHGSASGGNNSAGSLIDLLNFRNEMKLYMEAFNRANSSHDLKEQDGDPCESNILAEQNNLIEVALLSHQMREQDEEEKDASMSNEEDRNFDANHPFGYPLKRPDCVPKLNLSHSDECDNSSACATYRSDCAECIADAYGLNEERYKDEGGLVELLQFRDNLKIMEQIWKHKSHNMTETHRNATDISTDKPEQKELSNNDLHAQTTANRKQRKRETNAVTDLKYKDHDKRYANESQPVKVMSNGSFTAILNETTELITQLKADDICKTAESISRLEASSKLALEDISPSTDNQQESLSKLPALKVKCQQRRKTKTRKSVETRPAETVLEDFADSESSPRDPKVAKRKQSKKKVKKLGKINSGKKVEEKRKEKNERSHVNANAANKTKTKIQPHETLSEINGGQQLAKTSQKKAIKFTILKRKKHKDAMQRTGKSDQHHESKSALMENQKHTENRVAHTSTKRTKPFEKSVNETQNQLLYITSLASEGKTIIKQKKSCQPDEKLRSKTKRKHHICKNEVELQRHLPQTPGHFLKKISKNIPEKPGLDATIILSEDRQDKKAGLDPRKMAPLIGASASALEGIATKAKGVEMISDDHFHKNCDNENNSIHLSSECDTVRTATTTKKKYIKQPAKNGKPTVPRQERNVKKCRKEMQQMNSFDTPCSKKLEITNTDFQNALKDIVKKSRKTVILKEYNHGSNQDTITKSTSSSPHEAQNVFKKKRKKNLKIASDNPTISKDDYKMYDSSNSFLADFPQHCLNDSFTKTDGNISRTKHTANHLFLNNPQGQVSSVKLEEVPKLPADDFHSFDFTRTKEKLEMEYSIAIQMANVIKATQKSSKEIPQQQQTLTVNRYPFNDVRSTLVKTSDVINSPLQRDSLVHSNNSLEQRNICERKGKHHEKTSNDTEMKIIDFILKLLQKEQVRRHILKEKNGEGEGERISMESIQFLDNVTEGTTMVSKEHKESRSVQLQTDMKTDVNETEKYNVAKKLTSSRNKLLKNQQSIKGNDSAKRCLSKAPSPKLTQQTRNNNSVATMQANRRCLSTHFMAAGVKVNSCKTKLQQSSKDSTKTRVITKTKDSKKNVKTISKPQNTAKVKLQMQLPVESKDIANSKTKSKIDEKLFHREQVSSSSSQLRDPIKSSLKPIISTAEKLLKNLRALESEQTANKKSLKGLDAFSHVNLRIPKTVAVKTFQNSSDLNIEVLEKESDERARESSMNLSFTPVSTSGDKSKRNHKDATETSSRSQKTSFQDLETNLNDQNYAICFTNSHMNTADNEVTRYYDESDNYDNFSLLSSRHLHHEVTTGDDESASDDDSMVTLHRSRSLLESRIDKLVSFLGKAKGVRNYFVEKYGRAGGKPNRNEKRGFINNEKSFVEAKPASTRNCTRDISIYLKD